MRTQTLKGMLIAMTVSVLAVNSFGEAIIKADNADALNLAKKDSAVVHRRAGRESELARPRLHRRPRRKRHLQLRSHTHDRCRRHLFRPEPDDDVQ